MFSPVKPDWEFKVIPEYLDYVMLLVSDSEKLRDYIIDLRAYAAQLKVDLDYYKLATKFKNLDSQ